MRDAPSTALPTSDASALSPARMKALIDSSWDILSLLDREGRLLYNSPAAQRLHGFSAEEFAGRNTFELIHPEDAARVGEVFQRCLARPGEPVRVLYRYAHKTRGWMWMEAVAVNHLDDPMVNAVVVNSRDITERRAAEEARLSLERQLAQAQRLDSLGSVAGGVAHDMNNVLGSILLLSSAHEALSPPGSEAQEAFATITQACRRGRDMLRRLLDFARQNLTEVKPLDLNAVVREAHAMQRPTVPPAVRVALELDASLHPVTGDAGALLHALVNLWVNALDAMPHGGTLTLRTRNDGADAVTLTVEDTGHGMTREVLDRALDPFFTTKSRGHGTGLGLPLVYATTKAHQGTLTLESEPGAGTRVTLRLPAAPTEA